MFIFEKFLILLVFQKKTNPPYSRKLRPAFAPPAFYASPMFREFQEANLPAATAQNNKVIQAIKRKPTEESLSPISKNSPRPKVQNKNKSTQRQGKKINSNPRRNKSANRQEKRLESNSRIKQRGPKKTFEFRPGQGQAGILPLAYHVKDFPITAFRYPPYKSIIINVRRK